MMNEKNTGAVQKAKKSLMRSQVRAIIILLAAVILLGAVCAAVMYIVRKDIDVYTEVLSYGANGDGDTYISYYSRRDGDGFAVFDPDGNRLDAFIYEENVCYETNGGTILTLDENGMFKVIALLDNGDGETINTANTALLIYRKVDRSEIESIKAVNENGGYKIYANYEDTNGDGVKERNFYIEGYESSPISKITLSAIVTRCGILSLQVKLDRETMIKEDEKHKNDSGYTPIINPDGSVNFDIYGLGETYETKDEETGETVKKNTPYFILTDTYGNIHKVFIGDMTPDGEHYYVRYENLASAILNSSTATAEEKQREAEKLEKISQNVYLLAKDPSAASGYSSDVATTMLASAAQISAPTIIMPYTTGNYYDVRDFTVRRLDGEDYRKIICFTYDDITLRLHTIRDDQPYHIVDPAGLGLVGYELDVDRTTDALFALTDISAAASSTASSTMTPENTSVNYVKTVALVSSKINDLSKITEEMIKNDPEIRDSLLILEKYGLLEAEYILSFDTPKDINDTSSEIISQAVMISERTKDNTYFVWSPMFNQVVEIGAQYLDFVSWDSFDWVNRKLFHSRIAFSDGLRVTAGDFDVMFDLYQKITVTTKRSFSASSKGQYTVNVITDEFGQRRIEIEANIPYTATYSDGSTKELNHSKALVALNIATVENYCKRLLGDSLTGLTSDQLAAISKYASTVSAKTVANGTVTLVHNVTVAGDEYGYVPTTNFILTFTYSNGNLSLSAKQAGKSTNRLLYDAKVFSDYYSYYIDDKNTAVELDPSELAAVSDFFLTVSDVKTEETRVTASINGADPVDIDVDTFKDLYIELLVMSFYGRADKADSAGGTALTEQQMAELAQSDNCSMKIEFYRSVDTDLVFRSYDYSATKSYTTINRSGCFYINKMTKDAFIRSVKTVANGGSLTAN